jgi:hypothetical protein
MSPTIVSQIWIDSLACSNVIKSSHFHEYEDPTSLPSKPLGLHLLETLFSHYICAPVIFIKNQVINEYIEYKLPEHVAQAMFALASM